MIVSVVVEVVGDTEVIIGVLEGVVIISVNIFDGTVAVFSIATMVVVVVVIVLVIIIAIDVGMVIVGVAAVVIVIVVVAVAVVVVAMLLLIEGVNKNSKIFSSYKKLNLDQEAAKLPINLLFLLFKRLNFVKPDSELENKPDKLVGSSRIRD